MCKTNHNVVMKYVRVCRCVYVHMCVCVHASVCVCVCVFKRDLFLIGNLLQNKFAQA